MRKALKQALGALDALRTRDERNTCQHDETHRGGSIWEICDGCGAKWADDRGGKPKWKDPPEWAKADAAIAAAQAALAASDEPAGVLVSDPDYGHTFIPRMHGDWSMLGNPLYTHPAPAAPVAQPVREPLTEDEIESIARTIARDDMVHDFARAIERAHGIGQERGAT